MGGLGNDYLDSCCDLLSIFVSQFIQKDRYLSFGRIHWVCLWMVDDYSCTTSYQLAELGSSNYVCYWVMLTCSL